MQKHEDRHQLGAHPLAICNSSKVVVRLRTSRSRQNVPTLPGTPVLNVFAYIQNLLNVTDEDIATLDAHLDHAPMRLITMGVDSETKQASIILMSSN